MTLFEELNSLIIKYRFNPSKKLSQHFVIDESVLNEMVSQAKLKKTDIVLEIGCGTGFLTKKILQKCSVIGIEKDETLAVLLENELPKKNFKLINADFFSISKNDLPNFNKIVSTPPYNNVSKLLFKIFLFGFEKAVLLLQKEFCEKIVAFPGFKEFSALSVFAQCNSIPRIVLTVSPESFFPKPNSFSSIIVFDFKPSFKKVNDMEKFYLFLQQVFRFKNKNLLNALQKSFPFFKNSFSISKKEFFKRAENISFLHEKVLLIDSKDFLKVFNTLFEKTY
jgi:16S rRNA (adenine1518-N6/adenine1519-N6)-dimethyltransferase